MLMDYFAVPGIDTRDDVVEQQDRDGERGHDHADRRGETHPDGLEDAVGARRDRTIRLDGDADGANALREMLTLYCDEFDASARRQIEGVKSVAARTAYSAA